MSERLNYLESGKKDIIEYVHQLKQGQTVIYNNFFEKLDEIIKKYNVEVSWSVMTGYTFTGIYKYIGTEEEREKLFNVEDYSKDINFLRPISTAIEETKFRFVLEPDHTDTEYRRWIDSISILFRKEDNIYSIFDHSFHAGVTMFKNNTWLETFLEIGQYGELEGPIFNYRMVPTFDSFISKINEEKAFDDYFEQEWGLKK